MTPPSLSRGTIATFIVGGMLGLGLGWMVWKPSTRTIIETPAAAIRQADGSLVLERKAEDPTAKPAQLLPTGAKVERVARVVVRPYQSAAALPQTSTTNPEDKAAPAAVSVDLTLAKMPDGTQRIIASSPDGEVVGGFDIPAAPLVEVKVPKWQAVALVGFDASKMRRVYGLSVNRSMGSLVVEAGFIGETAFVGLGARW